MSEQPLEPPTILKLAILGEDGIGKTTFVNTFKEEVFTPSSTTMAAEHQVKRMEIAGQPVQLQIWDLGGHAQFMNMDLFPPYLEGIQAVAACFAVTDLETLDVLPEWINLLPANIPLILVGLKMDLLARPFDDDEVQPLLGTYSIIKFCQASAKDLNSVQQVFRELSSLAFEK
ncbi:MAG: Rab family GTPase [Candidatus Heimdallarchaeota archaeon]